MINRAILLTVLTAALSTPSMAVAPLQLDQTYNTGYVGTTALAAGLPDLNFSLFSFPYSSSQPVVASPVPSVWVVVPGAQFISPTEDQAYPSDPPQGNAPGVYDYDAQLSTNFLVPTSVTLTGGFAADNAVTLFVDGTSVTAVAAPAYASLTNFSYTFTIMGGTKLTSIDFVVNNLDDTNGTINPTGLLVSNLKATSSAPEPSTWLMMFAGVGVLLVVAQRSRRASAASKFSRLPQKRHQTTRSDAFLFLWLLGAETLRNRHAPTHAEGSRGNPKAWRGLASLVFAGDNLVQHVTHRQLPESLK